MHAITKPRSPDNYAIRSFALQRGYAVYLWAPNFVLEEKGKSYIIAQKAIADDGNHRRTIANGSLNHGKMEFATFSSRKLSNRRN